MTNSGETGASPSEANQTGMLEGIHRWLEKSGHGLELRVARTLRSSRAMIQPSYEYTDMVTSQQRELDVLAHFGWTGPEGVACTLTAVVECKSSTKHPWVAFYDRTITKMGDLDTWFTFAHGPFDGITEPLINLWIGEEPLDQNHVATHTAAAHTDDSINPALNAVRQVLSAATALRMDYIAKQGRERRGLVILPLIVTTAPLVSCVLGSDGEVRLGPIDFFHVWGYAADGSKSRVYVVSEGHLATFSQALSQLAKTANVR